MTESIDLLLAERAIRRVLTTYSRDAVRDVAAAETYAVAYHRYPDADGQPTDMWAGLRYVDRFERRAGEWRIRKRVCAYEWRRTDRVEGEGGFAPGYVRGRRSTDDIVFHILDD